MKVRDILNRVRELFRGQPDLPRGPLQWLIGALERTADEEISCDDVFRLLDEYAELHMRGGDAEEVMPLLKQHLDICGECCEEYDALLDVLREDQA